MTGFPLFRHFSALATPSDFASCFLRLRPEAARRFWSHVAAKAATRSAPLAGFRFLSRFLLHVVKSEKMRPPVRTDALRASVRAGRYALSSTYHPRIIHEASVDGSSTKPLRTSARLHGVPPTYPV